MVNIQEIKEDLEEFKRITPISVATAILATAIVFYLIKGIL